MYLSMPFLIIRRKHPEKSHISILIEQQESLLMEEIQETKSIGKITRITVDSQTKNPSHLNPSRT